MIVYDEDRVHRKLIPFCVLLVLIDMVWMMMDGAVRKLETENRQGSYYGEKTEKAKEH